MITVRCKDRPRLIGIVDKEVCCDVITMVRLRWCLVVSDRKVDNMPRWFDKRSVEAYETHS